MDPEFDFDSQTPSPIMQLPDVDSLLSTDGNDSENDSKDKAGPAPKRKRSGDDADDSDHSEVKSLEQKVVSFKHVSVLYVSLLSHFTTSYSQLPPLILVTLYYQTDPCIQSQFKRLLMGII